MHSIDGMDLVGPTDLQPISNINVPAGQATSDVTCPALDILGMLRPDRYLLIENSN